MEGLVLEFISKLTMVLFQNKGSVEATATYIESFFNQVAVLYTAENINTVISFINVWDTNDPFGGTNSGDIIDAFQRYILQGAALNGDLGHLVAMDPGGLGGVARNIGVLCVNDDGRLAYSDIASSFTDVPTYSWTVQVFTHEMGHNLGSPHTHGCYWNGNGTQIDDCGNVGQQTPEGAGCFNPASPNIPSFAEGGTIMSYCHLSFVGINFANGFGDQPGDLIRVYYNGAPCLSECPAGSCGVPYQLSITNIDENSASISWYHATENNFEITYGYPGNFTTVQVTGSSYNLIGLTSGTKYEVNVRTVCSGDQSEDIKGNFSTLCDKIYSLPYVELFEGSVWELGSYLVDPCWTSSLSNDGFGWSVEQLETNSNATGPSGDHTSGIGKYIYSEASFGSENDVAELISPAIDLGSSSNPFATFWYHMFGASVGKLTVEVSSNNGGNWEELESFNGQQQNSSEANWRQATIDLTDYEGETINLRFNATRGADFAGDIAIDDIIVTDATLIDVAVTEIVAPNNDCGLSSSETVTVTIGNTGYQPLSSGSEIGLDLSLNNTLLASETLTLSGNLVPGATVSYTFTNTLDLSEPGEYEISVVSTLGSDGINGNNERAKNVVNKSIVSTYPYVQSFESGSDWTAGGAESSWALGTPAKSIIIGASHGNNAWVTGGLGLSPYNADEESYLEGPCFDFSGLESPVISFDIWWEIETIWEGATFQYSTDAGANWQVLGSANDPNWFNADTITTLPGMDGWSGTNDGDNTFDGSGGWVRVTRALSGLGGNSQVFLRVFFKTDPFVAFDGLGIDNIRIEDLENVACHNVPLSVTTCDPSSQGIFNDTLLDVNGCDSVVVTTVTYSPIMADFTYSVSGPVATFTNNSTGATSYSWDFGDGSMSSSEHPSHTYTTSDTYEVQLIASAEGCLSDTAYETLANVLSSVNLISFIDQINIYPNPSNGNFALEITGQSKGQTLVLGLFDVRGKLIEERALSFNSYARETYQLDGLSNGVYFLRINSGDETSTFKINILK